MRKSREKCEVNRSELKLEKLGIGAKFYMEPIRRVRNHDHRASRDIHLLLYLIYKKYGFFGM
jgi:hypothetical protein